MFTIFVFNFVSVGIYSWIVFKKRKTTIKILIEISKELKQWFKYSFYIFNRKILDHKSKSIFLILRSTNTINRRYYWLNFKKSISVCVWKNSEGSHFSIILWYPLLQTQNLPSLKFLWFTFFDHLNPKINKNSVKVKLQRMMDTNCILIIVVNHQFQN